MNHSPRLFTGRFRLPQIQRLVNYIRVSSGSGRKALAWFAFPTHLQLLPCEETRRVNQAATQNEGLSRVLEANGGFAEGLLAPMKKVLQNLTIVKTGRILQ